MEHLVVFLISEDELERLRAGSSGTLLSVGMSLVSMGLTLLVALLTADFRVWVVQTVAIVVTAVAFILGIVSLAGWFKKRSSVERLVQTIRNRLPAAERAQGATSAADGRSIARPSEETPSAVDQAPARSALEPKRVAQPDPGTRGKSVARGNFDQRIWDPLTSIQEGGWKPWGALPTVERMEDGAPALRVTRISAPGQEKDNASVYRSAGVLPVGAVVRFRVEFRCAADVNGMIFVGDSRAKPPDNATEVSKTGTGDWEALEGLLRTTRRLNCTVWLYGNKYGGKPGDSVFYRNLELLVGRG